MSHTAQRIECQSSSLKAEFFQTFWKADISGRPCSCIRRLLLPSFFLFFISLKNLHNSQPPPARNFLHYLKRDFSSPTTDLPLSHSSSRILFATISTGQDHVRSLAAEIYPQDQTVKLKLTVSRSITTSQEAPKTTVNVLWIPCDGSAMMPIPLPLMSVETSDDLDGMTQEDEINLKIIPSPQDCLDWGEDGWQHRALVGLGNLDQWQTEVAGGPFFMYRCSRQSGSNHCKPNMNFVKAGRKGVYGSVFIFKVKEPCYGKGKVQYEDLQVDALRNADREIDMSDDEILKWLVDLDTF